MSTREALTHSMLVSKVNNMTILFLGQSLHLLKEFHVFLKKERIPCVFFKTKCSYYFKKKGLCCLDYLRQHCHH
jgi:hypothetical protein